MNNSAAALSDGDYLNWTKCLQALPSARIDLQHWLLNEFKSFFPCERIFLGYGISIAGEIRVDTVVSAGHSNEYITSIKENFDTDRRSSFGRWLATREPFVIFPENPSEFINPFEIHEIKTFGLKNVAAFGVVNPQSTAGTYCSFSGLGNLEMPWLLEALRLVAPVLNDLMLDVVAKKTKSKVDYSRLTPLQLRLARLVVDGLSNIDIGQQLDISEKTVRNQLSSVYSELNISNRTQLSSIILSN